MTTPVLLDMTRSALRYWRGRTPTGIDRVCDAYAAHFGDRALAVLQLRGRATILDREASAALFAASTAGPKAFRGELLAVLARLTRHKADRDALRDAVYLNVSHSDFDLDAHWKSLGRMPMKRFYLLHDLIPHHHPQVTTRHRVARHRGRVVKALRHATGIIANSQVTADDLRAFAGDWALPLPPLLVAPIAGANLPQPLYRTEPLTATFVSVGTIEARKNHILLLRAWSHLIDHMGSEAPRLVLAGGWGLRSARIRAALDRDPRLRDYVEIHSGLDDLQLAQTIAGARAVLLPTLAEGYGLPMVEALQLGVPVIASNLPSFREIGQGVPTLLDPNDVAAWVAAITDFCGEGAERRRQDEAVSGFRAPTWKDHFSALETWMAVHSDFDAGMTVSHGRAARC